MTQPVPAQNIAEVLRRLDEADQASQRIREQVRQTVTISARFDAAVTRMEECAGKLDKLVEAIEARQLVVERLHEAADDYVWQSPGDVNAFLKELAMKLASGELHVARSRPRRLNGDIPIRARRIGKPLP